jgi:hypothetical protein
MFLLLMTKSADQLMKETFPGCPLCDSEKGYVAKEKNQVSCKGCKATFASPDFNVSNVLSNLELTRSCKDGLGKPLLNKVQSVSFWKSKELFSFDDLSEPKTVQEENDGDDGKEGMTLSIDVTAKIFYALGFVTVIISLVSGGYSLYSLSLLPSQYISASYMAASVLSAVVGIVLWLGVGITEIMVGYIVEKIVK